MLENDDPEQSPILPSQVGGSFLYAIEKAYDDVILALTTMNSQQVADAVNQMFLTLNMAGTVHQTNGKRILVGWRGCLETTRSL